MATLPLRRLIGIGVWLALASAALGLRAEDTLRETTSLRFVPADAAFYRTCLRNREQFEIVLQSDALQRVCEAPNMARWLGELRTRWQDPNRGGLKAWLARPENRELASLAVDAASREVFWYGEASFADLLDLTAYVNQAAAAAQLEALRRGQSLEDSERAAAYVAMGILAQNPKQLRVPAMVIGFRVTDADRARRQIARLEEGLHSLLAGRSQLVQRLRREQVAGAEFLTWRLDGSLLPWDLVPKGEVKRVDPELRRRLEAVLKTKKATVSIGLWGDYLLVSLGEDNSHLAQLGQGPLLIDRPELAPLRKAAEQPITTIAYVSQAYREQAAAASQHQFYGSFFFKEFLKHPQALGDDVARALDAETRSALVADMKTLASELSSAAASRGAALRFAYLTPRGYEGYCYDWSQDSRLDGSQPLTVLNHLGGDPLAFFALRRKVTVDDYDRAVKWLGRVRHYFETIGVRNMSERRRAAYVRLREQSQPLWAQLDQANRELLIPALQDGQAAVALTRRAPESVEYVAEGEATAPPAGSPGLALAAVCGVSDASMLQRGCEAYFNVACDIWDNVRRVVYDVRSEVQAKSGGRSVNLPKLPTREQLLPQKQKLAQGTLYVYPLSDDTPLTEQAAPNVALSESILVASLRPEVSLRLLESRPLAGEGPLANVERPLAAAAFLDFAGLLDVLQPRLEEAVDRARARQAARRQAEQAEAARATASARAASPRIPAPSVRSPQAAPRSPAPRAASARAPAPRVPAPQARVPRIPTPPPPPPPRATVRQAAASPDQSAAQAGAETAALPDDKPALRLMLDVLRCFRGFASATYAEEGVWVTHYELRFADMRE